MTRDELLAKLDELDHSCSVVGVTVAALRAVVELHKPDSTGGCNACEQWTCLLYTSPSPRDRTRSRMPSSA